MIATVRTLGSQAGTQGRARGGAVGPLRLNNEARFFLLLFTHTHTHAHIAQLLMALRAQNIAITSSWQ